LHESHDSPGGGRARESREPAARRPDFDFFEPPVRLPGRASVVAPPPPGVKRETRVAIVQPHDTLQKIAQRELGDANQWRAILRSNPGLDPHKLKAGRELVLPIVVREPPKNVEPAARTHVVADGETLQSIALECYGDRARWIDLLEANRDLVRDPSALVVGTKLRIPSP
jgi:nucleoid-associated protein YgaU